MLFLWKYIDDLIGKGFEWYVILELMLYASATNVAMALPLSVLLSSIMTYGSLGENYELVAIKSAGISLTRAMYPMFVVVSILSVSAFFFSDYMRVFEHRAEFVIQFLLTGEGFFRRHSYSHDIFASRYIICKN